VRGAAAGTQRIRPRLLQINHSKSAKEAATERQRAASLTLVSNSLC
jgi:hypothetical protein